MRIGTVVRWTCALTAALVVCLGGQAAAEETRLLQKGTDPATGAEVRLYRAAADASVTLEIEHRDVAIRRQFQVGRSVIAIRTKGQTLEITSDQTGVVVSNGSQSIRAGRGEPARLQDASRFVAKSPAAKRAIALLGRMTLRPESPISHMILVTRGLLLLMGGDRSGLAQAAAWAETVRSRARLAPASYEQWTPNECWLGFATEVSLAWRDYQKCVDGLKWYQVFELTGCALVYDMRFVGAVVWYVGCVTCDAALQL